MNFIKEMMEKVLDGDSVTRNEAIMLYGEPIKELSLAADKIRKSFCGDTFDICTIINAKSGRCSEDCKYCAQSAHYSASCEVYPLLSAQELICGAKYNYERGVMRYSLVTSGRSLSDDETEKICESVRKIKDEIPIQICGSFGLLSSAQYKKLFNAGLSRIHNNLETSENNFPAMCTTHTFQDKIEAINLAKEVGFSVCSGGIFGIGESVQDRIDLAFSLKKLEVKSVPINFLSPIQGTPCEDNFPITDEDAQRIVAMFRFILPNAFIRLAGGRGLLCDKGRNCFLSGANAAISGDMLTTSGISIENDLKMIKELGYKVEFKNE